MPKLDLKNIKKQLLNQQKEEQEALAQAAKEKTQTRQEQNLFANAMSGVSPLKHDKVQHNNAKPIVKPRLDGPFDEEEQILVDPFSDGVELNEIKSEETISFCRAGIQKNVFKKLRSGTYRISDELDLHGATLKQAKQMLIYYLQEAAQFENCCIRIIHGKGHRSNNNKPVLKTHLNHWLQEHERVLAFHSAKPADGGRGAVYVLLRRS